MLATLLLALAWDGVSGAGGSAAREATEWKARRAAHAQERSTLGTDLLATINTPGERGVAARRRLLQAQPAAGAAPRPYRMAHYLAKGSGRSGRTAEEIDYLMEKLMPATSFFIGSSVRSRLPSGPLEFPGFIDYEGETIPTTPGGFSADMLIKVTVPDPAGEACGFGDYLAAASSYIFEDGTGRPIFGEVLMCAFSKETFLQDLQTTAHELIHALGFSDAAFVRYQTDSPITATDRGRQYVVTPMVRDYAQRFFNCCDVPGGELEGDGGVGSALSHWEARVFEGEMMDAAGGGDASSGNQQMLTDLTLSLLQDTGWYDVKYGSAGLLRLGYGAGCRFARGGRPDAVAADPAAAPYICDEDEYYEALCTPDHTGSGVCLGSEWWDGFTRPASGYYAAVDCLQRAPQMRCLQRRDSRQLRCLEMSCSANTTVLIDGEPCDSSVELCPDDGLMCDSPGWLTCGALDDCSGQGLCARGRCHCFTGWGGPDCSVPLCTGACDDGSRCPTSGFCGVADTCGWSVGAFDRGTPCQSANGLDFMPPRPSGCPSPVAAAAAAAAPVSAPAAAMSSAGGTGPTPSGVGGGGGALPQGEEATGAPVGGFQLGASAPTAAPGGVNGQGLEAHLSGCMSVHTWTPVGMLTVSLLLWLVM